MNNARAEALLARNRLTEGNWISRTNESFRHVQPPAAAVWLGDTRHRWTAPAGPCTRWAT